MDGQIKRRSRAGMALVFCLAAAPSWADNAAEVITLSPGLAQAWGTPMFFIPSEASFAMFRPESRPGARLRIESRLRIHLIGKPQVRAAILHSLTVLYGPDAAVRAAAAGWETRNRMFRSAVAFSMRRFSAWRILTEAKAQNLVDDARPGITQLGAGGEELADTVKDELGGIKERFLLEARGFSDFMGPSEIEDTLVAIDGSRAEVRALVDRAKFDAHGIGPPHGIVDVTKPFGASYALRLLPSSIAREKTPADAFEPRETMDVILIPGAFGVGLSRSLDAAGRRLAALEPKGYGGKKKLAAVLVRELEASREPGTIDAGAKDRMIEVIEKLARTIPSEKGFIYELRQLGEAIIRSVRSNIAQIPMLISLEDALRFAQAFDYRRTQGREFGYAPGRGARGKKTAIPSPMELFNATPEILRNWPMLEAPEQIDGYLQTLSPTESGISKVEAYLTQPWMEDSVEIEKGLRANAPSFSSIVHNVMNLSENFYLSLAILHAFDRAHGTGHAINAVLRAIKDFKFGAERYADVFSQIIMDAVRPSPPAGKARDSMAIRKFFGTSAGSMIFYGDWTGRINNEKLWELLEDAMALPADERPDPEDVANVVGRLVAWNESAGLGAADRKIQIYRLRSALGYAREAQVYFEVVGDSARAERFAQAHERLRWEMSPAPTEPSDPAR